MQFKFVCAAFLLLASQAFAQQKAISPPVETIDVAPQGECSGKPHLPGYYAIESTGCAQYVYCDEFGNQTLFNCGEGTIFSQRYLTCDYPANVTCSDSSKYFEVNAGIGEETGVETPKLPSTSFTCANKPHLPGLYADLEANCALFHYCYDDQDAVLACPPNTLFSQEKLICDYAENVNCAESANFYDSNKGIGQATEETAAEPASPAKATGSGQQSLVIAAPSAPAPSKTQPAQQAQLPAALPSPAKAKRPAPQQIAQAPAAVESVEARVPIFKSKQIAALRRGSSTTRKATAAGTKA